MKQVARPRTKYGHGVSIFRTRVLKIVKRIPEGKAMTYGEVARAAGKPHAARGVGAIMRANRDPGIPCHRVVRSDGGMGGYNRGGSARKEAMLREEGALQW